jgi:hypothetical protein
MNYGETYDTVKCKEKHHPWMDCPKCEHCGEYHCSLNAIAHKSWVAIEEAVAWPQPTKERD